MMTLPIKRVPVETGRSGWEALSERRFAPRNLPGYLMDAAPNHWRGRASIR